MIARLFMAAITAAVLIVFAVLFLFTRKPQGNALCCAYLAMAWIVLVRAFRGEPYTYYQASKPAFPPRRYWSDESYYLDDGDDMEGQR